MDERELWEATDRQRQVNVDLLRDLSPSEWTAQSLCDDWTVREVAAHLTFPNLGIGGMARMILHTPGGAMRGTNGVIAEGAKWLARKQSTDEILNEVARTVGGRRTMPGLGVEEMLIDAIAHGFDIAAPLGRSLPTVPGDVAVATDRVLSYGGRGNAKVFRKFPLVGLQLVADDHAWSHGAGLRVRGSMADLFLLVTGRMPNLRALGGDGADELRGRLGHGARIDR